MLSLIMCQDCNGFANKQWICSLIFLYYVRIGGCPAAGAKQALPCLTDCKSAEIRCEDRLSDKVANYTETITCPLSLNDNQGCQQNRKGDFCNRPPFLLRSACPRDSLSLILIIIVCRDCWCP